MKNIPPHLLHTELFCRHPILPTVKISVVIPVKDEETHVLQTLQSLADQIELSGNALNYKKFEILILANNCTDRTVEIISDFQKKYSLLNLYLEEVTLGSKHSNVGYVRRILMNSACTRLNQNGGGTIMTTDGDTRVAADWIVQTQKEIRNGADAVGGRILLCPEELLFLDKNTTDLHFKDEEYRLLTAELEARIMNNPFDSVPSHHQHFNGSFAVTTECYGLSGGVPAVPHLEDCAFFEKLQNIDAKVRHSFNVCVYTSARYVGRAEVGLSFQLNGWKNSGMSDNNLMVESADSLSERFYLKKELLELWKQRNASSFNSNIELQNIMPANLIDEKIIELFDNSKFFGEWYSTITEKLQLNPQKEYHLSTVTDAIADLEKILSPSLIQNFSQTSIR